MVQVTYQKNNGTIFKRYRYTAPSYKIGERTSMGWIVLNVEYEYNNQYYTEYDYYKILHDNQKKRDKEKRIKETCMKEFKTFMYYFIAIVVINCLKFILGIR